MNRHLEHVFAKLGVDKRQKAIVTVMERLGTGVRDEERAGNSPVM